MSEAEKTYDEQTYTSLDLPILEQFSKRLLLQRCMELPIDVLHLFDVTDETVSLLRELGLRFVKDLCNIEEDLVLALFPVLPEADTLIELWRDLIVERTAESLRKGIDEKVVSVVSKRSSLFSTASTADESPQSEKYHKGLSKGCALHASGDCRPCAWFHHSKGCSKAEDCEYCHSCPPGELRRRKAERAKAMREQNSKKHIHS